MLRGRSRILNFEPSRSTRSGYVIVQGHQRRRTATIGVPVVKIPIQVQGLNSVKLPQTVATAATLQAERDRRGAMDRSDNPNLALLTRTSSNVNGDKVVWVRVRQTESRMPREVEHGRLAVGGLETIPSVNGQSCLPGTVELTSLFATASRMALSNARYCGKAESSANAEKSRRLWMVRPPDRTRICSSLYGR